MTTLSIKTVATLPEYAILAGYPGIMRIRHEAKHEIIYCIKTRSTGGMQISEIGTRQAKRGQNGVRANVTEGIIQASKSP